MTPTRSPKITLFADTRGGISVEYLVLTSIGLMIVTGLAGLGLAMVHGYGRSLHILYGDCP